MNNTVNPIYIFLKKDDEIMEFCKFVNDQLFMNVDVITLYRAIKTQMQFNHSLCSISPYENYLFSLEILPVERILISEKGSEYLLFGCRYDKPLVRAMSFNLAKKLFERKIQCRLII